MRLLSLLYFGIQRELLPALVEQVGPLDEKHQQFVRVREVLELESFLSCCQWQGNGRKPKSRVKIALAFVAKALWNMPTTRDLVERLHSQPVLRRLCGWDQGAGELPDEATFSRAFATFAQMQLGQRVHEALIRTHLGEAIIWHSSTDATAIAARERPLRTPDAKAVPVPKPVPVKRKRGRPAKGQPPVPPPEPTRLQRHLKADLATNLADMPPVLCNSGCKKNSQGKVEYWRGYKLHLSTGDGDVPLCAYLSSASLHDSQPAILLQQQVAARTKAVLYELKDAAYDAAAIKEHSCAQGSVAIIEPNRHSAQQAPEMEPDRIRHYKARSSAERVNSDLKDNHGGRHVRVRGADKVMSHLMFGILVMSAEALLRLL